MTPTRPHPDLWYPIAALLVALRKLLRATDPFDFASIAREARVQLIVLTALIRRYLYILAAGIILPPLRTYVPRADNPESPCSAPRYQFPLIEQRLVSGPPSQRDDPPDFQWQILMEAVSRLVSVLANPDRHARRLALALRNRTSAPLRDLPIPWHIIRQISPALDNFINQVDALARPEAWAGIDTS